MALIVGARLASYEILGPLGAGGMGEVYKAVDTRLDRLVAIKVLPPHLAADAQFRERFNREARVISALDHPHICALCDVGELFFLSETREAMAVSIAVANGTLEVGTPQRLFPTNAASFAERNSWEVAQDGQRFVVNSVPMQRAPITVVVNWLQGLARASARR